MQVQRAVSNLDACLLALKRPLRGDSEPVACYLSFISVGNPCGNNVSERVQLNHSGTKCE